MVSGDVWVEPSRLPSVVMLILGLARHPSAGGRPLCSPTASTTFWMPQKSSWAAEANVAVLMELYRPVEHRHVPVAALFGVLQVIGCAQPVLLCGVVGAGRACRRCSATGSSAGNALGGVDHGVHGLAFIQPLREGKRLHRGPGLRAADAVEVVAVLVHWSTLKLIWESNLPWPGRNVVFWAMVMILPVLAATETRAAPHLSGLAPAEALTCSWAAACAFGSSVVLMVRPPP